MKDVMRISTVNFNARWGDSKTNTSRMLGYIEEAVKEGADLIVFPEMALTGYDDEPDKAVEDKMQTKLAETVPGPSSNAIAELTKKYGVYVVYGLPERDADDPSVIYNSACVLGPEGIIGTYRKIHLCVPEPNWGTRGDTPFILQTPWGPIGIGICYDVYAFPELMRYYAGKGCRVYINLTAHAKCHGNTIARTTLEAYCGINNMYIVSSNLVGLDLYNDFWGTSSIIGPGLDHPFAVHYYAGYPFADPRGHENKIYTETIDLTVAGLSIFNQNPALGCGCVADFRPALYKKWMEELAEEAPFKED